MSTGGLSCHCGTASCPYKQRYQPPSIRRTNFLFNLLATIVTSTQKIYVNFYIRYEQLDDSGSDIMHKSKLNGDEV